jgi:uncharacterized protein (DUF488 family)
VDVRRFPSSKKYPYFNKENLEVVLPTAEIKYSWQGEDLGGFRKGGYPKYMKTDTFKDGINKLLKVAKTGNVALMCAEIVWFRCHRSRISEQLTLEGYEVIHIIDDQMTYTHKLHTSLD